MDQLQTSVLTIAVLLAFWVTVVLREDRRQVKAEGPGEGVTQGTLVSLTTQSEAAGLLALFLVPATVACVALTWGDVHAWWMVVMGVAVSLGISAGIHRGLAKGIATVDGREVVTSQTLASRVSLYSAAVCAGLAVVELPQLVGGFDPAWLMLVDIAVSVGEYGTPFLGGVCLVIVGLVMVGHSASCFRPERRQMVGWLVGVLLLFVGNLLALFPCVFRIPVQVLFVPWLLSLLAVMLPSALVMAVNRPSLHGARELALCKDVMLGLMTWVMLRWLLWPNLGPLHGQTWDVFLIGLAPRLLVCLGIVLAILGLGVRGLRLLERHEADQATIRVADSIESAKDSMVRLGATLVICGIPIFDGLEDSKGGLSVSDDMREMVQKAACWKNLVLPVMMFSGLVVAFSSVRNYFLASWLVSLVFMVWLVRYSVRFADNRVTPQTYFATALVAGLLVAVEMWLVSCGFLVAALVAACAVRYLSRRWNEFRKAGCAHERAFVTRCLAALALFAACAMAKTGNSARHWLLLAMALGMTLAALWMTSHDDLPRGEAVDGRRRGMSLMRCGIAAGFAVLTLALNLAAPGPAAIAPFGASPTDPMRQGYHGSEVVIAFANPDQLVSARYQVVDDFILVSENQSADLGTASPTTLSVSGKHLVVWATYADGTKTRADYWAYLDDGSWSRPLLG